MWNYPDDLFIGLEFNLSSKSLVRMFIGHYSEDRPDVDLQDRYQREQKYWQYGNVLIVALQNCIKSRTDFSEFIKLIEREQLVIDLPLVFIQTYKECSVYTSLNEYGKRKHNVHPYVFRRAVRVKHDLSARAKEFGLKMKWIPNNSYQFPMELGGFLQQARG